MTPQRIFRIPPTIPPLVSNKHRNQASLNSSPVLSPIQSTFVQLDQPMLASATTSHHGNLPLAVPASPVAPFDINCPEMVYEQYLRQKAA